MILSAFGHNGPESSLSANDPIADVGRVGQKHLMDWTDANLTLDGIHLPDALKANVLELLAVAEVLSAPYEISVNDYDGGLSLHWNGYEVAAFEDRYETYQFSAGDTRIRHWPHTPRDAFDPAFTAELGQAAT